MTTQEKVNAAGMARADYRGLPSTLCQGCGHNSIANQIIAACYELDIVPENVVKFSGIGCSSKSPTYFLSRSFGFNGLHGRMPSLALGAMFGDTTLKGHWASAVMAIPPVDWHGPVQAPDAAQPADGVHR
jgi:2-oxoglutarate/2-oxoacid ferredoxin oxidoreductase subunit beta